MLKKSLIAGSVLLIVGVVYLIGFHRPRYESERALSLAEAKAHLKVELPSDAEQIRILDEYVGPGHFRYMVRFRAPFASCSAWAERLTAGEVGWQARDIAAGVQPSGSHLPAWFDVHSIQEGRRYVSGGTPIKEVWIDRRTETAYYSEAD